MRRVLLACILLFFSVISADAQHLKPRGFIGIAPQPVPESVMKFLGLRTGEGAIIKSVIPGGTAAAMGIQENDVVLKINGQAIRSPKEVHDIAAQLTAGDRLTLEVNRNKELKKMEGTVVARPMGYPDNVETDLHEFSFQNGYVRSVLFRPKGVNKDLSVIYLVQGYPCFSMAYLSPDHPYRTVINEFVKKGYAVYITEKPGMGDCAGTAPCPQIGFNTELDAFKKGYEKLLTLAAINKDRVFLFGHSLGGFIAPLLAEAYKPKGVVVYGCGIRPWHDYLVDLVREQFPYLGMDMAACEDSLAKFRGVLYEYFFKKRSPDEMIKNDPASRQVLNTFLSFDGKDQLVQRHYRFWQELNDYNLTRAWKNTTSPVLSIFGEADIAALKPADMERIAEVVNNYHPGNGKYLFVPKTNHDMVKTGNMKENMSIQFAPGYQQYLKDNFNYELLEDIHKWMQAQV